MTLGTIPNVKIKVLLTMHNGKQRVYKAGTQRRYFNKIMKIDWKTCYIKVWYGRDKDIHGKMVEFYNEGIYTARDKALQAFRAFLEDYGIK